MKAAIVKEVKKQIKRPGIHAKSKASHLKQSKHYKKKYRGQGK
jgi:hypothetical protein